MNARGGECRNLSCREYSTELDGLLGHDRLGHQARNILAREDITTRGQLAQIPDARLLEFENFGEACLARVREHIPAPAATPAPRSDFTFRGGTPS